MLNMYLTVQVKVVSLYMYLIRVIKRLESYISLLSEMIEKCCSLIKHSIFLVLHIIYF